LLYDYIHPQIANTSFFDVFFQVKAEDYLVRIQVGGPGAGGINNSGIQGGDITNVWTKPVGTPSNVNPDGTFNTGTPWVLASAADLVEGRFQGRLGFGPSEENLAIHPMAEFEVSINTGAFQPGTNPATGLYDPNPAFWSG